MGVSWTVCSIDDNRIIKIQLETQMGTGYSHSVVSDSNFMANFKMAADAMFQQPKQIIFKTADENKVDSNRLVIGVEINGETKAYPIQLMGYHHHLQDSVGGKAILVTYCTVCRT